jgi:hypothetical protein
MGCRRNHSHLDFQSAAKSTVVRAFLSEFWEHHGDIWCESPALLAVLGGKSAKWWAGFMAYDTLCLDKKRASRLLVF